MFLAALGILGLIIHATGQRRKEIGVRKVLGASVSSIVHLFSFGFLQLILVAGLATTIIALATISLQAVKAALDNPIKSLRTEG